MTEAIDTATFAVVRFLVGGAPDWDPARARRGGDLDEWALRRGVEDVREVRS